MTATNSGLPVESRRKYLGDESTYGSDVCRDSDRDSYDCDGDGQISDSESFDNLAEYESKIYGKKIAVGQSLMRLAWFHMVQIPSMHSWTRKG